MRCRKHGHKSKEAAEAQLRALLRRVEKQGDYKDPNALNVYYCLSYECRDRPWHVGHRKEKS